MRERYAVARVRACVDEAYGELIRRDGLGQRLWDRARARALDHPTWHPDVDALFDPHAAVFDFDDPLAGLWGEESSDDDVDDLSGAGA